MGNNINFKIGISMYMMIALLADIYKDESSMKINNYGLRVVKNIKLNEVNYKKEEESRIKKEKVKEINQNIVKAIENKIEKVKNKICIS